MDLNEYVFGWASRVFPEDLVSHEDARRFRIGLCKLLKISLHYTLASHVCSFVICTAFTLPMVCFHLVPFSQEMKPPENYYYTPWAVGFQYGCSNTTLTFLAPLFLVSFIFGFRRSRVFWFVLLPLGIACVPVEAMLGYYNYQFWAHRFQQLLYSYYVATLAVFVLTGVCVVCHFRIQRWIIWDFFKVGCTIIMAIGIFNNCILPAFGIGFAPRVHGVVLTPFTPDSNTPKWKTLLFRILGVPAFMQLIFFLMRHSAISSKVAAQERSHVYWCWGHAMSNIYLRLIAFELDTLEIFFSSFADMMLQIFLTLAFVMPIKRTLKRLFSCCTECPTRHNGGSYNNEEQDKRNALIKDCDKPRKSEEIEKTYGTFRHGRRNFKEKSDVVSEKEDEDDMTIHFQHENRSNVSSNSCQNTCKINVQSHDSCHNIQADQNMLANTHDNDGHDDHDGCDDGMFNDSNEKFIHSYDGSTQQRKLSSDTIQQSHCKARAHSFDEKLHAPQRASHCNSERNCRQHNIVTDSSLSSSARHSDVDEVIVNSKTLQDSMAVHLTNQADEPTLTGHGHTENENNNGNVNDREKTIIEIFFHSNTISKMVGIFCSVEIYTLMYRHRDVYDLGYVNQPGGVHAPIQITQILACICIPLVFEVIGDIISNMVTLKFGWFSVIPVWATHGFRITCVVGVSFLVMLPSILHGFIALPMADNCKTLDVCTCQHIFKWLADKCNTTHSTAT